MTGLLVQKIIEESCLERANELQFKHDRSPSPCTIHQIAWIVRVTSLRYLSLLLLQVFFRNSWIVFSHQSLSMNTASPLYVWNNSPHSSKNLFCNQTSKRHHLLLYQHTFSSCYHVKNKKLVNRILMCLLGYVSIHKRSNN